MIGYTDAHCHHPSAEMLERARSTGIRRFLQGGVEPEEWDRQLLLRKQFPGEIGLVFGVHPWKVTDVEVFRAWLSLLRDRCTGPEGMHILAIGEIGLDFGARATSAVSFSRACQQASFVEQLRLASEFRKPVVLHVVKAHREVLRILEASEVRTGVVHSFAAGAADAPTIAAEYVRLGFGISIGSAVLRLGGSPEGLQKLQAVLDVIPSEKLLLETDSPDQLPEPASLWAVARIVAAVGGQPPEEVLEQSTKNVTRIFKWNETT